MNLCVEGGGGWYDIVTIACDKTLSCTADYITKKTTTFLMQLF